MLPSRDFKNKIPRPVSPVFYLVLSPAMLELPTPNPQGSPSSGTGYSAFSQAGSQPPCTYVGCISEGPSPMLEISSHMHSKTPPRLCRGTAANQDTVKMQYTTFSYITPHGHLPAICSQTWAHFPISSYQLISNRLISFVPGTESSERKQIQLGDFSRRV